MGELVGNQDGFAGLGFVHFAAEIRLSQQQMLLIPFRATYLSSTVYGPRLGGAFFTRNLESGNPQQMS